MKNEMIAEPMKSAVKYKETELGCIPQEWKVVELKNVISVARGGSPRPIQSYLTNSANGLNWIKIGDTGQGSKYIISTAEKIIESGANFSRKVSAGDFLLSNSMSFGRPYILKIDGCIHDGWLVLQNYQHSFHTEFLYYTLSSNYMLKQYLQRAAGSSVLNLNKEIVSSVFLIQPPLAEQTAIAEALSDADAMIASLEKLIDKKKKIKQGAMQELLRPKEGWVKRKIRDISVVGRGRVISHKEISAARTGMFPVYSSQTSNNGIMGYIDTFDFEGEYVTWTTDGEKAGTVFYRSGKFNCTNVCGTIRLKSDYTRFVALMLSNEAPKYVSRNLANPKLMNEPMKNIEIDLPPLQMQMEIAHTVLVLDSEIEANYIKLEKLVRLKQGMMQNLLTGKFRLS